MSPYSLANGQDYGQNFVDAFDTTQARAAAFHNEKFNEAERALFEGLSRRDEKPQAGAQKAKIHPISATKKMAPKPSPVLNQSKQTGTESTRRLNESFPGIAEHQKPSRVARSSAPVIQKKRDSQHHVIQETAEPSAPKSKDTSLQAQLSAKDAVISDLQRQLSDAKSKLATAELEISRLSSVIQDASRARLSFKEPSPKTAVIESSSPNPVRAPIAKTAQASRDRASAISSSPAPSTDMQVATISAEKADLRLGPGRNHSALMSLRKGSRLAVEARQGEWYRVFAPNGQRAWIHSSLVRFGDGAASLNDGSSVMVRGYDSKLR